MTELGLNIEDRKKMDFYTLKLLLDSYDSYALKHYIPIIKRIFFPKKRMFVVKPLGGQNPVTGNLYIEVLEAIDESEKEPGTRLNQVYSAYLSNLHDTTKENELIKMLGDKLQHLKKLRTDILEAMTKQETQIKKEDIKKENVQSKLIETEIKNIQQSITKIDKLIENSKSLSSLISHRANTCEAFFGVVNNLLAGSSVDLRLKKDLFDKTNIITEALLKELELHELITKELIEIQKAVKFDKSLNKGFEDLHKNAKKIYDDFNKKHGSFILRLNAGEKLDWKAMALELQGLKEVYKEERDEMVIIERLNSEFSKLLEILNKISASYQSYKSSEKRRDEIIKNVLPKLIPPAINRLNEIKDASETAKVQEALKDIGEVLKHENEIKELTNTFEPAIRVSNEMPTVDNILLLILKDFIILLERQKSFSHYFDYTIKGLGLESRASRISKRIKRKLSRRAYRGELKELGATKDVLKDFDKFYKEFKQRSKELDNLKKDLDSSKSAIENLHSDMEKKEGKVQEITKSFRNIFLDLSNVIALLKKTPQEFLKIKEAFLKTNETISNSMIELSYMDDSIKSSLNSSLTALEHMAKILEIMDENNTKMELLLKEITEIK